MLLNEFPFDDMDVSDVYKEVYNRRPDDMWWKNWKRQDRKGRKRIWNTLVQKS